MGKDIPDRGTTYLGNSTWRGVAGWLDVGGVSGEMGLVVSWGPALGHLLCPVPGNDSKVTNSGVIRGQAGEVNTSDVGPPGTPFVLCILHFRDHPSLP